ncbi:hypothetical protein [uncultured Akkermansia sp.]|jgi:hypothetical protein|nr:hypothetical protein [uncultured Akkermansia sp.]
MSWGAAKLAVDQYGPDEVDLVFADTGIEDEDNYRFIVQGAGALGCQLHIVRMRGHKGAKNPDAYITPWELCTGQDGSGGEGMMANSRVGFCSILLKRKPLDTWMRKHCTPETRIVIGFNIEEIERCERLRKNKPEWNWWFPLAEKPYSYCEIKSWLEGYNVRLPRLYDMGFNHANCGGFCFKAGIGHFVNLLEKMPERFAFHERMEQRFRDSTGKHNTILRRTVNGEKIFYPLSQLRQDYLQGLVRPSDFRMPCECGVMWEQPEFNLMNGKEEGE